MISSPPVARPTQPPHAWLTATTLYFAYGSNMLLARLQARVPGATRVGTATLKSHALRWHKLGQDQSGKCDVVATANPSACVHGVLYHIPTDQKPALDRAEDLGRGYAEKPVLVERGTEQLQAFAYVALQTDPNAMPFTWYQALVVAGALENQLPAPYVATLRATPAKPDPDATRHAANMRLIQEQFSL